MIPSKQSCAGRLVKLLLHKRLDRGMTLIPEASRCVRRNEIHELVATDQRDLGPGRRLDRAKAAGLAGFRVEGAMRHRSGPGKTIKSPLG